MHARQRRARAPGTPPKAQGPRPGPQGPRPGPQGPRPGPGTPPRPQGPPNALVSGAGPASIQSPACQIPGKPGRTPTQIY